MNTIRLAAVLAVFAAPAMAQDRQQEAAAQEADQISRDMIRNVDAWIGDITRKLDSDKPMTAKDFDSVFGESFFTDSQDPIGDLEKVQQRVNARLGDRKGKFDEPYGKWMGGKLSAADLNPEVSRDAGHVTVDLDAPKDAEDAMKVDIAGGLIKMSYTRQESRRVTNADGSVSSSSFSRTLRRAMAVPKGADPARYRVSAEKNRVRIIFDRLGKKDAEASK